MGRLDGKVAIISGTGGGQGRAAALRFTREGAKVVGCGRNTANAEETVAMVRAAGGDMVSMAPVDLTSPDDAQRWVDFAMEQYGRIDIVYNNAGEPKFGTPGEMSIEDWRFTMANELDLSYYVCRAAWPHLIGTERSCIVNVASIAGTIGVAGLPQTAHAATKMGIIGMTRQLAAEGAPLGIRANVVSPGLIDTPATAHLIAMGDDGPLKDLMAGLPLGRAGASDEVVNAALFLASDEASYITGENLVVDGGTSVLS